MATVDPGDHHLRSIVRQQFSASSSEAPVTEIPSASSVSASTDRTSPSRSMMSTSILSKLANQAADHQFSSFLSLQLPAYAQCEDRGPHIITLP